MVANGQHDKAREALRTASAREVLDSVYAFMNFTTVTVDYITYPADRSDPETLATAMHVIRNVTWP